MFLNDVFYISKIGHKQKRNCRDTHHTKLSMRRLDMMWVLPPFGSPGSLELDSGTPQLVGLEPALVPGLKLDTVLLWLVITGMEDPATKLDIKHITMDRF